MRSFSSEFSWRRCVTLVDTTTNIDVSNFLKKIRKIIKINDYHRVLTFNLFA